MLGLEAKAHIRGIWLGSGSVSLVFFPSGRWGSLPAASRDTFQEKAATPCSRLRVETCTEPFRAHA